MKLLTFLGTAKYQETTYLWQGKKYTTCYCSAALAHFFQPNTTLVVVTQAAREKHFTPLQEEIGPITHPEPVSIPDGHSEADLWAIFEALTQHFQPGDEVMVDITNGFRSLPFLSFLAITFLRLALGVTVAGVYYGAWEARNPATNESPIFDLTPFLTLLDWTIATDRFNRFGDATDLAQLLKQKAPPGPLRGEDMVARKLGHALDNGAKAMETVSLALRLTRPLETMTASNKLITQLTEIGDLMAQEARPFGILTKQIQQVYQPISVAGDPLDDEHLPANLTIQWALITKYKEQGQIVQAVTLAREWLVSQLVYQFGGESLLDYEGVRKLVENALNNAVERRKPDPRTPLPTPYDEPLQALPHYQMLGTVWDRLGRLRNDLAHVGMRLDPLPAVKLCQQFEKVYEQLKICFGPL